MSDGRVEGRRWRSMRKEEEKEGGEERKGVGLSETSDEWFLISFFEIYK